MGRTENDEGDSVHHLYLISIGERIDNRHGGLGLLHEFESILVLLFRSVVLFKALKLCYDTVLSSTLTVRDSYVTKKDKG